MKRGNRKTSPVLIFIVMISAYIFSETGCRLDSMPPASSNVNPADSILYGRIGGQLGVTLIIDTLMAEIRADPQIAHYFTTADTVAFMAAMDSQLCQLSGGPCGYSGPSMSTVHHGMNLSNADFDAFITDYLNSMNSIGIADTDQQHVLDLLVSYQTDIVGQ